MPDDNNTDAPRDADNNPNGEYDGLDRDALIAELHRKDAIKKAANDESASRRLEIGELQSQLQQLQQREAERERKRLEEQGKWQEIAQNAQAELEQARAYKERYEAIEQSLAESNEQRIASMPEDLRQIVPQGLTPEATARWLDVSLPLLQRPKAPDLDAGARSTGMGTPPVKLSAEEKAMADKMRISYEDYAKYKAGSQ